MKYHVIDENKVRTRFENRIITGNLGQIKDRTIKFTTNDVEYEFKIDLIEVIRVTPLNENANALTTDGLVKWNNYTREIHESRYGGVEIEDTEIENYNIGYSKTKFCSGYICLGSLPSKNAIRFSAKDIKIYDSIHYRVRNPDYLEFTVYETEDSIIIEKGMDREFSHYKIGPFINGILYPLTSYSYDFSRETYKFIITKGTCYRIREIVHKISKEQYVEDDSKNYYEFCF